MSDRDIAYINNLEGRLERSQENALAFAKVAEEQYEEIERLTREVGILNATLEVEHHASVDAHAEVSRLRSALEVESKERWKMMNERNTELAWSRTLASKMKELCSTLDAAGALLVTRPARDTLEEYNDAHS